MTGSITGTEQHGLQAGFKPSVMVGVGDPDGIIYAPSGTYLRDYVNDAHYINSTAVANGAAGSTWATLT